MRPLQSIEERLDYYYRVVNQLILSRQNPVTGLIPASVAVTTHGDYRDAWVRDNVYSILAVFGLALAYRRLDDDHGRAYELEHAVVKLMRGLLFSMMRQSHKVERFKHTQALHDALHAKYNTNTGDTVVGDGQWGHLQIDATSIFLLMLAQMTTAGFQVVYTQDEVDFVQNLVFYIERAYRTNDYGIWERGNKINHGEAELNCSSIGMALAALQAINGVNLFGSRGGPSSVIYVLPDEITRNYTTLHSFLPRESNSKEIDAALLSVISYPAFAVSSSELIERTKNEIVTKLKGRYGCKRFLRDGHQTIVEDTSRLHYNPHELKIFENIECEWPLFFTYFILDGIFTDNWQQVEEYRAALEPLIVYSNELFESFHSEAYSDLYSAYSAPPSPGIGLQTSRVGLIPELYYVPRDLIQKERDEPHSQSRLPNDNIPLVWASSLHILGNLIYDQLLSVAEVDPLGRRFNATRPHKRDTVVQVVLLSENQALQETLRTYGLETQTLDEVSPVTVFPPNTLRDVYAALGMNQKLGLSGRPKRPVGTLATCRLYRMQGKLYAFTPHFMDVEEFYLTSDNRYLVSAFESELNFVRAHWVYNGRPTMVILLTQSMLGGLSSSHRYGTGVGHSVTSSEKKDLFEFFLRLRSGNISGTRVRLGRLTQMVSTSMIESLDFLVHKQGFDWRTILGETHQHRRRQSVTRLGYNERQTQATNSGTTTPKRPLRRNSSFVGSIASYEELASPYYEASGLQLQEKNFKLRDHKGASSPYHRNPSQTPSPTPNAGASNDDQSDAPSSTPVENGIVAFTLGDPVSVPKAIDMLCESVNLFDQIDLLQYILSCHGMDYYVDPLDAPIRQLIEEVYFKALQLKLWSIVRQAAGLLRKAVNSLTINITDLIIRQKMVTIGHGQREYVIFTSLSPDVLINAIFERCGDDAREGPLIQEVLTNLGSLIRMDASMFDGIRRLRIHYVILAMREELARLNDCDADEAVEHLMQLSPYEIKSLLATVLSGPSLSCHDVRSLYSANIIPDTPHGEWTLAINQRQNFHFTHTPSTDAENTFEYTSNLKPIPGKESGTAVIRARSAGYVAGNYAHIEINGVIMPVSSRGLNVVVLDVGRSAILETANFDTHISQDEAKDLVNLIECLDQNTVVVICGKDECSEQLTESARAACESLGSAKVREVGYRDSWCLIGIKGAALGSVPEAHKHKDAGATDEIQYTVELAKKPAATPAAEKVPDDELVDDKAAERVSEMAPSTSGRWLRRRKNDGALNRLPPGFYARVWKVLSRCRAIVLGREGAMLPRDPTVAEKTPEEPNFALMVENLLDRIADPAERQVAAETLMVIADALERNSDADLSERDIDLTPIILDAIELFWAHWVEEAQRQAKCGEDEARRLKLPLEEHARTSSIAKNLFFDCEPASLELFFHQAFTKTL
ncbi:uncharacterized protein VTP21DRAFT_1668 [Calcarisporiella thermophila]|uniref:uncharacterized protein n=1 Tax=Calcarisporiella thermophila TaxID=911321 RepID=UPI0037439393